MPKTHRAVQLIAGGDAHLPVNQAYWPGQETLEKTLSAVLEAEGVRIERMNLIKKNDGHGLISTQREGVEAFRKIDPEQPIIVAQGEWLSASTVLAGLTTHKAPILILSTWGSRSTGHLGLLNLSGALAKAGVKHSMLWSEDFTDAPFLSRLRQWLKNGKCSHDTAHVQKLEDVPAPKKPLQVGEQLARQLQRDKAIMGVIDEGCMGHYGCIVPDHLLHHCGIFKERLSQAQFYQETQSTSDEDAVAVLEWMEKKGMTFHWGKDGNKDLTRSQVLLQCKMYVALLRLADAYGCESIGLEHQQGLRDALPSLSLAAGLLSNTDRAPVRVKNASRVLYKTEPLPFFTDADECGGLDAFLSCRVQKALDQPVENTAYQLRWGDYWNQDFVWTLQTAGAVAPAHLLHGWKGVEGKRQPLLFYPKGGSAMSGLGREGEIIWSRIFVEHEQLHLDLGRGASVPLPKAEVQRRLEATNQQLPLLNAHFYGISRDQMLARQRSHHIQISYATSAHMADECLFAKAALARALGMKVQVCGALKKT
jgi:hypothetical protein